MRIGASITENITSLLQTIPNTTFVFVKQEMVRFGNRFRRTIRTEHMRGRPGIDAPKLRKGKNVAAWTSGDSIRSLATSSRIGRILVVHETGATINSSSGKGLYIHDKGRKNIVARVQSVTIPARLQFRETWRAMVPEERIRIRDAGARALRVASERSVKRTLTV